MGYELHRIAIGPCFSVAFSVRKVFWEMISKPVSISGIYTGTGPCQTLIYVMLKPLLFNINSCFLTERHYYRDKNSST